MCQFRIMSCVNRYFHLQSPSTEREAMSQANNHLDLYGIFYLNVKDHSIESIYVIRYLWTWAWILECIHLFLADWSIQIQKCPDWPRMKLSLHPSTLGKELLFLPVSKELAQKTHKQTPSFMHWWAMGSLCARSCSRFWSWSRKPSKRNLPPWGAWLWERTQHKPTSTVPRVQGGDRWQEYGLTSKGVVTHGLWEGGPQTTSERGRSLAQTRECSR